MNASGALLTLYIVLAVVVMVVVGVVLRRGLLRRGTPEEDAKDASYVDDDPTAPDCVWMIVNPTKPTDYEAFQNTVNNLSLQHTGKSVRWLETTREDPGTGQAIFALQHHPAVVIAAGGDGTVRAVAAGMSHSAVPMGIIPVGTGNLVARNLDLPLELEAAFEVAVSGETSPIDLAWLRTERVTEESTMPPEGALVRQGLERGRAEGAALNRLTQAIPDPHPDEYSYLVISGVGFDGETMANTTAKMKKAVGWTAYVFTALRSLRIERMKATVTLYSPLGLEGEKPTWAKAVPESVFQAIEESHTIKSDDPTTDFTGDQERITTSLRARTVLMANCGELPFTTLSPYAEIDDGALDVIAIDTQAGLLGWTNLAVKVMGQGLGLRPINSRRDLGQISFQQCRRARIDINRAYPVQVDGDHVGSARTILSRIDESALLMRHPWDQSPF